MEAGVDLVNAALWHLGEDPVAALDPADSTVAGRLAARYPRVRDAVLRSYVWNFAEHYAALPARLLPEAPFGFLYAAELPAGPENGALPYCLRVLNVDTDKPWAVKGRTLHHVAPPPLMVCYIKRVEDVQKMDALCFELIAAELALSCAAALGTSERRRQRGEVERTAMRLRREARRVDATEGSPRKLAGGRAPSWVRPRLIRGG